MSIIKNKILIFFLFILSCTNKNITPINENNNIIVNYSLIPEYSIDSKLYVIPSNGLNLRSEPSKTSTKITILPQNTELTVLEKNATGETIDNLFNYWYKVNTGNEIGWVFGEYLARFPIIINNNGQQVPKFIYDLEIKIFPNGNIFFAEGAIEYHNKDEITIYENSNKESNYFISNSKTLYLYRIAEIPDWFYSITSNAEALGYIYIYDISEKSFFGNFEEKISDNNWHTTILNSEYELIKQYHNINRYGPLLTINNNNMIIEFLNTFNGLNGGMYQLINYYPEYNEILAIEQYYEGNNTFIYDLNNRTKKCEFLAYHHLYFNETRTYLFSLDWGYGGPTFPYVKIYNINNGYYQLIYDDTINNLYSNDIINNISWINDNIIKIDCTTGAAQIIINNETIEIINNLEYINN